MFRNWFRPRKYVWRNADFDIPVKLLGFSECKQYAHVEYEGTPSYVPAKELYYETNTQAN